MKNILSIVLLSSVVVFSSCGPDPDPDPTPAQLQLEKLAGAFNENSSKTWTVSEVLFDGLDDRTADWAGFTVTISGSTTGSNSYTTTGAFSPGPWPSSGTWTFGGTVDNPNINLVVRDTAPNELDIAINASVNQLIMTFTFDDAVNSGGRTEVVNGEYRFTFTSN